MWIKNIIKCKLVIILAIITSCKNNNQNSLLNESKISVKTNQELENNKNIRIRDIKKYIQLINEFQNERVINNAELLIPTSEEEYLYFYSLTNNSEDNKLFLRIDSTISDCVINDKYDCFKKYLYLSEFVDGEYAESYFEDVDFIIYKNKNKFCEMFKNLDKAKTIRLLSYYDDYCTD